MTRSVHAALICLFSCTYAYALPDAPKPKVVAVEKPDHSRRIWLGETAVLGALYASDFTLTARGLGTHYNNGACCRMEADPLYGTHPSNARLSLITAAQFAGKSLLLYKTERSKHAWVRWSGRAVFAYTIVDEARAIHSWKR